MENFSKYHFESYLTLLALLNDSKTDTVKKKELTEAFSTLERKLNDFSGEIFGFPLKTVISTIERSKLDLVNKLTAISAALYLLNEEIVEQDLNFFYTPSVIAPDEKDNTEILKICHKVYARAISYKSELGKFGVRTEKIEKFKNAISAHENVLKFFEDKWKNSAAANKIVEDIEKVFDELNDFLANRNKKEIRF